MNRYIKSVVASLLLIVFVFSGFVPTYAVDEPSKYSTQYNSGTRDVVCTTFAGTSVDAYYNGNYEYDVLSQKSSSDILSSLRTLMRTTHTYISSYDDCHYKADRTDCQNEDGSVSLIYTSYSATMSQWNGWNREHVWPKSLGGDNTSGGGADLHHIRPSDAVVNSTRGNKKYGNANGGKATYGNNPASGYLGGYSGTYYEPLDNVKGDVARICLYVYVRWGSDWGATSITSVFQSVDVLLEWCALDPVDTWEMGRNEVVQSIQGNRNVFIDYPEYAWLLFGKEVPANMTTPSGNASNGSSTPNPTTPPATEPTPTQPAVTPTEPSVNPTEPQPTEPPIDLPANTDGFKEAVTLATTATTGDSKFNALKEAVTIYNSLSSADKASVAQEYQLLLEAAGAYNQIAQQLNSDKESEHRAIIGATVLSVSVISYAAVQLLSKKYL